MTDRPSHSAHASASASRCSHERASPNSTGTRAGVDDDVRYSEWLRHHLDVLCPQASVSMLNLEEFERWCTMFSGRDCDLLMLAANFGASPEDPAAHGLSLLRRLRDQPATPAVVALAEAGNELTAVRALQLGAVD